MPNRLEIALKESLLDAEGEGICQKAKNYFNLRLDSVRTIQVVTIDAGLSNEQLQAVQTEAAYGAALIARHAAPRHH